jgi:hypothetical protein
MESGRALLRIRFQGGVPESRLADARRELDTLWNRCESEPVRAVGNDPVVYDLAAILAPDKRLRTLLSIWRRFSCRGGGSRDSTC